MWYTESINKAKTEQKVNKPKDNTPMDLDTKIVRNLAEDAVRRSLYYKGTYYPDKKVINKLVKKTVEQINEKYNSPSAIRNKSTSEDLSPLVDSIVEKLI